MGKLKDWSFAWLVVYFAIKKQGYYLSPATTEFEAIKTQKILGGPKKVVYEVHAPDVVFFRPDVSEERRNSIITAKLTEILPMT